MKDSRALYELIADLVDEIGHEDAEREIAGLLTRVGKRSHAAISHDRQRRVDWRGDGPEPPERDYNPAAFAPNCEHSSDSECDVTCRRAEVAGQVHLARVLLGIERPESGPVRRNARIDRDEAERRIDAHTKRAAQYRKLVNQQRDACYLAEELGLGEAALKPAHSALKAFRAALRDIAGEAPLERVGRAPKRDAEVVTRVRNALEAAGMPSGDADAADLVYGPSFHVLGGRNAQKPNAIRGQRRRRTS